VQIRLDMDINGMKRKFLELEHGERRLGYGVAFAINDTAKDVRGGIITRVHQRFIIRNPRFIDANVAVVQRASVRDQKPYAEIYVNDRDRFLMSIFEEGGERKPFTPGAKSVAVPLTGRPARPGINRPIDPRFTFKGLHFVAFFHGHRLRKRRRGGHVSDVGLLGEFGRLGDVSQGAVQWKGQERTFLLPSTKRAPLGAVFQRIGPGRGDIREIWSFVRGLHLDDRLGFVQTATRIANERFGVHLDDQLRQSILHADRRAS
jgi:hypothetical protein